MWDDTKLFGYNASHGNLNQSLSGMTPEPTSFARVNRICKVQYQNGYLDYRGVQPKDLVRGYAQKDCLKLEKWDPKQLENEKKERLCKKILKAGTRRMSQNQQSEYEASFDTKPMERKELCKSIWRRKVISSAMPLFH